MPLWTPANISEEIWLDGADASSFSVTGSNRIAQWNDKSSNGRHATQATDANRLLFVSSAVNGQSAVRGDGAARWIGGTAPTLTQPFTFFIVSKISAESVLFDCTSRVGYTIKQFSGVVGRVRIFLGGPEVVANSVYTSGQTTGLMGVVNSSSSQIWNFGTQQTVAAPGANSGSLSGSYRLGDDVGDYNRFLNGDLCEFVLFSGLLSATTRDLMFGYLAWKWGEESQLPANHPYKNAAPTIGGNAAAVHFFTFGT